MTTKDLEQIKEIITTAIKRAARRHALPQSIVQDKDRHHRKNKAARRARLEAMAECASHGVPAWAIGKGFALDPTTVEECLREVRHLHEVCPQCRGQGQITSGSAIDSPESMGKGHVAWAPCPGCGGTGKA